MRLLLCPACLLTCLLRFAAEAQQSQQPQPHRVPDEPSCPHCEHCKKQQRVLTEALKKAQEELEASANNASASSAPADAKLEDVDIEELLSQRLKPQVTYLKRKIDPPIELRKGAKVTVRVESHHWKEVSNAVFISTAYTRTACCWLTAACWRCSTAMV